MRLRVLAVSVLVLAALAGWLWIPRAIEKAPEKEPPAERAIVAETPRETSGGARATLPASSDAPPETVAAASEVRGTVVDPAGAVVPDVRVREPAEETEGVRTGPDGGFVLRPIAEDWALAVDEPGWTTLRPATFEDPPDPAGVRIVAARSTELDGRVVDREGPPLPGARIDLRAEGDASARTAYAGFEGRFHAEGVPAIPGVRVTVSLAGWRPLEEVLDLSSSGEVRFVLDREDPGGLAIEGEVVHADGTPASNALVAFGAARTRTDGRGRFRLVCGWFDERTPLVAAERGSEASVLEGFGASCLPPSPPPAPVRLVLAGRARAIAGKVVGERGEPCKGFDVFLLGATPLDPAGIARDVVELESGGPVRCRTDAQGRFRLGGLRGRAYAILAAGTQRSARSVVVRADAVAADTLDLELRVPDGLAPAPIRGRILDLAGSPVAGARVGIGRAVPPGDVGEFGRRGGRDATTGADGRFELQEAFAGLAYLVASGDGFVPARLEIPAGAPRDSVEIRLRSRRALRVDASRATPAPDAARALDAAGRAMPLWSGSTPIPVAPLRAGLAEPVSASGDASAIVLTRGGREIARIPLPPGNGPVDVVWP